MAEFKRLKVDDIFVPARLRAVEEEHAIAIAQSIVEHGLINPVTVRATPAAKGGKWTLVAGAHRLRAMAINDETEIEAVVIDADRDEAQLVEITENLFRNDLSVVDRAVFVQSYRDIWEQRHGKIHRGGDQKSKGQVDPLIGRECVVDLIAQEAERGFAQHVADRLGISKRSAKRLDQIARHMHPELRSAVRGTPVADNQSQLLKLAALEPERQRKVAISFASDKDISRALELTDPGAKAKEEKSEQAAIFDRLVGTWDRADEKTKAAFLKHVAASKSPRQKLPTLPDRFKTFTGWMTTAVATGRTLVRAYLESFGADAYQALLAISQRQDELERAIQQLALNAGEAAGTVAKESSVAVRFRDATAGVLQSISASIGVGEDGNLKSVAEALTALFAAVGDQEAGILWRMAVEAGEGDVVARVVLQVRATVDDDYVTVGTIWEAGFVGGDPEEPFGRMLVLADQFIVTDGDAEHLPLVFEGGVLYLNGVKADWADIENVEIVSAQIGELQVTTSNLDFGAVTDFDTATGSGGTYQTGSGGGGNPVSETTVASVTIDNPGGFPVMCDIRWIMDIDIVTGLGGNGTIYERLRLKRGSTIIHEWEIALKVDSPGVDRIEKHYVMRMDDSPPTGSSTYSITFESYNAPTVSFRIDIDVDVGVYLQWNKR